MDKLMEKELDVEYLRNILSFTNFTIAENSNGFFINNLSKKPESVRCDIAIIKSPGLIKCTLNYIDKITDRWGKVSFDCVPGRKEFAKQLIYTLIWIN